VHDLEIRILDSVLDELCGQLLGDDYPFAVLAILASVLGECLGGLLLAWASFGSSAALGSGQEPVAPPPPA